MTTSSEHEPLSAIIAEMLGSQVVTVGEVADRVAQRGFGLMMSVLALPTMIPVLPPGSAAFIGLLYILLAVQMLIGMREPWLPARVRNYRLTSGTMQMLRERGIPLLRRMERLTRQRGQWVPDASTARIGVRRVIPALLRSQTGTAVAIASRDLTRAREIAAKFQIPRTYGSYETLLADRDIDAVYNPLPNSLHPEWTIRAAQAGKHVLCEKPLAVNAVQAQTMVDACRKAGVLLQEAFMYRYHPQIGELRRLTASGAIGDPWLVRSTFTFTVGRDDDIRLNASLGGGGLLDVGCYCVNISRLLLGEPQAVTASGVFEHGVDVRMAGLLTFAAGAAVLDCGLRMPYRQICEVVGTTGAITLPRPFQPEEDPAMLLVRRGEREERVEIPGTNQYTLMLDHMGACLLRGQRPQFPPEDAVANLRVLDALRRAATSGTTVPVA